MLALCACSQESFVDENNGDVKTIRVIGPEDIAFEGASTRGTEIINGSTLRFSWALGDSLGIFPDKGNQVEFPITSTEGGTSAVFDGGGWALRNNSNYAAYYPFSVWNYHRNNKKILLDYSGQVQHGNGSFAHLSAYDYLASSRVAPENGVVCFEMKRLGAILYIDIVVPVPTTVNSLVISCDEDIFTERADLDISGEDAVTTSSRKTNTLTLEFKNTVTTEANETVRGYLAVFPLDFREKIVYATLNTEAGKFGATVQSRVVNQGKATFLRFSEDFVSIENIQFADPEVKRICVENWDTNRNGRLSYEEAAAVTSLSVFTKASDGQSVFAGTSITSFDELVYFTGLTSIDERAFENCNDLSSITLPESVIEIGDYAFSYCRNLVNISIPNSVTRIGKGAFSTCDSLKEIIIPNGVTSIEERTFETCNSLSSITLGNSISTIGSFAFNGCGFSSITIPDSVTSIGKSAFQASSIKSITMPESVTTIGSAAFAGCKQLLSITLPKYITSIESYIFQGCSNLVSVTIPDGVTSIGSVAFQGCTYLQSIDLPKSINRIGSSAFSNCSSLSSITIRAETVPTGGQNMFSNTNNCPIYVPAELVESYLSAQYWSNYADRIQQGQPNNVIYYTSTDGNIVTPYDVSIFGANFVSNEYVNGRGTISFDGDVRSIGKNAFYQCETLKTLSIPPSVTTIGDWAFAYCSNISAITIPEGVKSIRDRAFIDCSSLVSIFIPSTVTTIGVYVFNQCSSLSSIVVSSSNQYYDSRENCNAIIRKSNNKLIRGCNNSIIPDGITSIDSYAFSGCSQLAAITIPDTVTSIGIDAFYHCSSITSINIPRGITTIDLETFVGCTSLKTVTLPESVTSIKDYAFLGCSSLESINIPANVTNIGQSAFSSCSRLASISLPENLTTIWNSTFSSCTSLTSVDLPSNLTTIKQYAFKGCSSLLSITIPESVQYIQTEAFRNCSSLTSITVKCVNPPSGSSPGSYLMFDNTGNCPIYVPAESVAAYKASQDWKSYASRIQAIPD